jgi:hypothetical protein
MSRNENGLLLLDSQHQIANHFADCHPFIVLYLRVLLGKASKLLLDAFNKYLSLFGSIELHLQKFVGAMILETRFNT